MYVSLALSVTLYLSLSLPRSLSLSSRISLHPPPTPYQYISFSTIFRRSSCLFIPFTVSFHIRLCISLYLYQYLYISLSLSFFLCLASLHPSLSKYSSTPSGISIHIYTAQSFSMLSLCFSPMNPLFICHHHYRPSPLLALSPDS